MPKVTLAEVIADAPDFIKLLDDAVTIAAAIKAGKFSDVLANLSTYEADVLKVYNDIEAKAVANAIAAGTVTAVAS